MPHPHEPMTNPADTPAPRVDHDVTLNGMRFHCVSWGCAGAPVLLALHGLRSYAETFEDLALALADRWQVISLDQRGRGSSDWDPQQRYDTLTYVADVEALVQALGLRRFYLLGHSMGGANAIVYAARHPQQVAGLVIEDMGPGASASSAGAERIRRELAATPDAFADWATARRFWRSIRPHVTEAAIDSRVRHSLEQAGDGRVVWRHDQAGIAQARTRIAPLNLWPHLEALLCPVLLLRGMQSDFLSEATALQMRQRCRSLREFAVPGAGHYVHDDAPQVFIAAVRDFLNAALP